MCIFVIRAGPARSLISRCSPDSRYRAATRPITVIAQTLLLPLENDLSRIVLGGGFIGASRRAY